MKLQDVGPDAVQSPGAAPRVRISTPPPQPDGSSPSSAESLLLCAKLQPFSTQIGALTHEFREIVAGEEEQEDRVPSLHRVCERQVRLATEFRDLLKSLSVPTGNGLGDKTRSQSLQQQCSWLGKRNNSLAGDEDTASSVGEGSTVRLRPRTHEGRRQELRSAWHVHVARFQRSRVYKSWSFFQILITLACTVLTIMQQYAKEGDPQDSYEIAELVISLGMGLDIIVQAVIAPSLMYWFCQSTTFIDLICLGPLIVMLLAPDVQLDILRILRMTRLLRVLRAYRMVHVTKSETIFREVAVLVYTVVVFILLAAGYFLTIDKQAFKNFHTAIYFVVVTLTTVGYGDFSPGTTLGRMSVCILIFAAVILLPAHINRLCPLLVYRGRGFTPESLGKKSMHGCVGCRGVGCRV